MGKIVAIGGGELRQGVTEIDRFAAAFTGKARPSALFLPTASQDAPGYVDAFGRMYGGHLGCEVRSLLLTQKRYTPQDLKSAILSADLIYVGGGDTGEMMDLWRRLGVDVLLQEAYERDIVLSGLSAGSICWFEKGYSDSARFAGQGGFGLVDGLGMIPAVHCPHFDEDERGGTAAFARLLDGIPLPGLGLENNCALAVDGKSFRILTAGGRAFVLPRGKAEAREIPAGDEFAPISRLWGE